MLTMLSSYFVQLDTLQITDIPQTKAKFFLQ